MRPIQRLRSYDQFNILSDRRRLAILRLLMAGPASLTQLGSQLGEHPAWVRHHLKQLEDAGLIAMRDIRVSGGHVEKYYQAQAQAFLFQELLLPDLPGQAVVVMAGSHDIALELLIQGLPDKTFVLNLPVGSLDGLVALRQGLCQVAGCHLFDSLSGDYNLPFVRHLFPDQPILLLTLAQRQQGLMVAPGNPHAIRSLADLARPDVQFINRNRGSGTRLWLDDQFHRLGVGVQDIQGYRDEAVTHTQVADAIRLGVADVGLGIQAAARIHGLDFIPLFQERYDLALPQAEQSNPSLAPLLDGLQSARFRQSAEKLGGYDLHLNGVQWKI